MHSKSKNLGHILTPTSVPGKTRTALRWTSQVGAIGFGCLSLLSLNACSTDDDPTSGTDTAGAGGADTSNTGGGTSDTGGGATIDTGGTSTSDTGGATGTGQTDGTATDEMGDLIGALTVTLTAATDNNEARATMQGNVRNGPLYRATVWELTDTDADCELLEPRFTSCLEPECEFSETCIEDEMCVANSEVGSAGILTVTGLLMLDGKEEFEIDPFAPRYNYQPKADIDLAYPPAGEGTEVVASAAGGDFEAFTVSTTGIAPLVVTSGSEIPLTANESMLITWEAAGSNASSLIEVDVDISHHGGAKGKILCRTADDGSLEISAALATSLLNLGVAGFPAVTISRMATGSTQLPHGRVEFSIVQHQNIPIVIDGVVSCSLDEDCTDGTTCLGDLTCG